MGNDSDKDDNAAAHHHGYHRAESDPGRVVRGDTIEEKGLFRALIWGLRFGHGVWREIEVDNGVAEELLIDVVRCYDCWGICSRKIMDSKKPNASRLRPDHGNRNRKSVLIMSCGEEPCSGLVNSCSPRIN